MTHVYHLGAHVASINKQSPCADGFRAFEPWLLLRRTGRVDRFANKSEACAEARKHWGRVQFRRT